MQLPVPTPMPVIHHATSSGSYSSTIVDEMFQDRELLCIGEIDRDLASSLIVQLRHLEKLDPTGEVTLLINSNGGEVSSGLALYDVMQAVSCPVRTVCMGTAASMASILLMAGSQRDMLALAPVMIHDPLISGGVGGSALSIDSVAKSIMHTRDVIAGIVSRHTGKTVEEVLEATAHDAYFEAREAIEWGLADRIISEI